MPINCVRYVIAVIAFCSCYCASHPHTRDDFPYYTREAWGAAPATERPPLSLPVPFVVIHHTYLPEACNTTAACAAAMRSMQKTHQGLDWGDIGYNFGVGSEGGAYEGRGWTVAGIHARSANNFSIGIALIGDWRTQLPPAQQLATTKALIARGVGEGYISPQYKIIGHNQVTPTECPGGALLAHVSAWDHYLAGHVDFHKWRKEHDSQ